MLKPSWQKRVVADLIDTLNNLYQTTQLHITDDSVFWKISLHLMKAQTIVHTSHQFESHKRIHGTSLHTKGFVVRTGSAGFTRNRNAFDVPQVKTTNNSRHLNKQ